MRAQSRVTVSGPAAVAARGWDGLRLPILISVEVGRVGFRGCHSVFSQMAAGELHEDIFEAGLARAEVFELMAVAGYRIQKSGDGEVRLADTQADGRIFATDGLHAGQRPPAVEVALSSLPLLLTWNSTT